MKAEEKAEFIEIDFRKFGFTKHQNITEYFKKIIPDFLKGFKSLISNLIDKVQNVKVSEIEIELNNSQKPQKVS